MSTSAEAAPEAIQFDLEHIVAVPLSSTNIPDYLDENGRPVAVPVVTFRTRGDNEALIAVPTGVTVIGENDKPAWYVGSDQHLSAFTFDEQGNARMPEEVEKRRQRVLQTSPDKDQTADREPHAAGAHDESQEKGYPFIADYELGRLARNQDYQRFQELADQDPQAALAWITAEAGRIGVRRQAAERQAAATAASTHLGSLTAARALRSSHQ